MKYEIIITEITPEEEAEIKKNAEELTEEGVLLFNSDETALEGATLKYLWCKARKDLFNFLRDADDIKVGKKSLQYKKE